MVRIVVIILLIIFFIYMLTWTINLSAHDKRQNKMKRIKELKEKKNPKPQEVEEEPVDVASINETILTQQEEQTEATLPEDTKEYWVNLKELSHSSTDREKAKCYHYFDTPDEAVKGLLMEMYDFGIVRMDELEKIAYGTSSFEDVDLSFLEELEKDDEVAEEANEVMEAAKDLEEDDPGITDIRGTLSDGVEKVIEAVDKEKEAESKKKEPISGKKEKSVEKSRKNRAKTSNQEIRNKIYMKWEGYINQLNEMVDIKASIENQKKIDKALKDYGYNDVDVLLKSPE